MVLLHSRDARETWEFQAPEGFQAGVNGDGLSLPWHLHSSVQEVSKADWIIQGSPCNSLLGHIQDKKIRITWNC